MDGARLAVKLCPRCRRLMPDRPGSGLCARCAEDDRTRERRRGGTGYRDPARKAFYNSKAWKDTAAAYRVRVGHRCEGCGGIGTDVHHVKPISTKEGWERRLDFDNLKLLCVRCHNKEHGRFGDA